MNKYTDIVTARRISCTLISTLCLSLSPLLSRRGGRECMRSSKCGMQGSFSHTTNADHKLNLNVWYENENDCQESISKKMLPSSQIIQEMN